VTNEKLPNPSPHWQPNKKLASSLAGEHSGLSSVLFPSHWGKASFKAFPVCSCSLVAKSEVPLSGITGAGCKAMWMWVTLQSSTP
jgi:hypothetical protein